MSGMTGREVCEAMHGIAGALERAHNCFVSYIDTRKLTTEGTATFYLTNETKHEVVVC